MFLVLVWRLVSVCKFHFFAFLVCKIGNRGAVVRFYGWSFRYSFALLTNLKKSEASGVVRPVRVVLFLSG